MPTTTLATAGVARTARRKTRRALVVDGRMLFSSGIGRYLREILQRIPKDAPFELSAVYNTLQQKEWLETFVPSAVPVASGARIYSCREQWLAFSLPADATFWVPHYNIPRLGRCRVVATVHDLAPLALPGIFRGRLRQWAARFYFGGVKRRACHVIAVSRFTHGELLRRGLAQAENISVIPNGVGAFWRRGRRVPEVRNRLLYVGNLKPHKNLARLIEAVEIVQKRHPVELAITGRIEGFRTGLDRALLKKLDSTDWIRLLGETTDGELREHYQQAGALVFPSLYEGFGLPLLEALAAGCPAVASNIGALTEIGGKPRQEGGAVEYFDPYNVEDMAAAIDRTLALSDGERNRVKAVGRAIASAHTWDKAAESTWSLLAEKSIG
ncbi:MAG TPA: glycosyltransferase family 1 protein [Opitutaceae bacterium]|nr:glycosyltransferase family 1 protein [Opitutaceae bacterium]